VASALTAAGASVATAGLVLIVICWRSKTALGGVLGAVAISLVAVGLIAKPTGVGREAWLLIALIVLLMGVVLYVLGRLADRLLADDPEADSW
jgi:hypothetical protein